MSSACSAAPVKYTFPERLPHRGGALNRGEPLVVQHHRRLSDAFEDFARDVAGLPVKPKEAREGRIVGRLGGRR